MRTILKKSYITERLKEKSGDIGLKKEVLEVWVKECPPHERKLSNRLTRAEDVVSLFREEPKRLEVYVTLDNNLPRSGAKIIKGKTYSLQELTREGYYYFRVVYRNIKYGFDRERRMMIRMKYACHRWTRDKEAERIENSIYQEQYR